MWVRASEHLPTHKPTVLVLCLIQVDSLAAVPPPQSLPSRTCAEVPCTLLHGPKATTIAQDVRTRKGNCRRQQTEESESVAEQHGLSEMVQQFQILEFTEVLVVLKISTAWWDTGYITNKANGFTKNYWVMDSLVSKACCKCLVLQRQEQILIIHHLTRGPMVPWLGCTTSGSCPGDHFGKPGLPVLYRCSWLHCTSKCLL